jgi:hypothetical protein
MTNRSAGWILSFAVGLFFPVGVLGCSSQAGAICSLECECEHCNDIEESVSCESAETQAEIAEAYDCLSEWEEWATCVEEKGECNEDDAQFSTQEPGSCNASMDSGFPCTSDAECEQLGSDSCEEGTCRIRVCAESGNQCTSNEDCPTGEDRCQSEQDALTECQDDASDASGFFFGLN